MGIRFKRLIAFAIDWNITLLPFVFIFFILKTFLRKGSAANPLIALLCFLAVLGAFSAFVLRDVLFKGRSLGKRIFGLYVYDKITLNQASVKQLFLRNIFFFLYFIDGIVLLTTGQTLGDRAAGTLVTKKQDVQEHANEIQDSCSSTKRKNVKIVVLFIVIIVACVTLFIGLINIILDKQKNSEEYKVAYSYLVESDAFKQLNVDESKILFSQYSLQTYSSGDNGSVSKTAKIGFIIKHKSFEVVCHNENNIWQVCDECTLFE